MMHGIKAGTATIYGEAGADYTMFHHHMLPVEYITKEMAKEKGWRPGKNLHIVLPNKTIGGDIYFNDEGKLPIANNRIWYEADLNYISKSRNSHRLLYSNDGLVFVTFDHYDTFFEIT